MDKIHKDNKSRRKDVISVDGFSRLTPLTPNLEDESDTERAEPILFKYTKRKRSSLPERIINDDELMADYLLRLFGIERPADRANYETLDKKLVFLRNKGCPADIKNAKTAVKLLVSDRSTFFRDGDAVAEQQGLNKKKFTSDRNCGRSSFPGEHPYDKITAKEGLPALRQRYENLTQLDQMSGSCGILCNENLSQAREIGYNDPMERNQKIVDINKAIYEFFDNLGIALNVDDKIFLERRLWWLLQNLIHPDLESFTILNAVLVCGRNISQKKTVCY